MPLGYILFLEDIPLVEFIYFVFIRICVGDSSLCCRVCVTFFER